MEEAVWSNPREVRAALSRLGLTVEPLLDAVRGGYLARISRTENDAPNAAGLYQWNQTLRMLREHLVAIGWDRNNEKGLATVVNPMRVSRSVFRPGTRTPAIRPIFQAPSTRRALCTAFFVASNAQTELFPELIAPVRPSYDGSAISTWALLFYTDFREIKSELSLPVFMDGSGQISGWKERIILPTIPLDGDGNKKTIEPDFGPAVDIDIRRRA